MKGDLAKDPLLELLDEQRAALIAGDLSRLEGSVRRIEIALSTLAKSGLGRQQLDALRAAAARNAGLIQAAQQGLRQAQMIAAQSTADRPLATYSATGGKAATNREPARVLKRI